MICITKIAGSTLLGAILVCLPANSRAADFTVSNVGLSAYQINGANNPTLTLLRGHTYTFAVTAAGHPFWVKTNQITGTGSAYDAGVTGNGTASGTLTFTVATNAPNALFYICQFHATMTGRINVTNPPPPVPIVLTNLLWRNGQFGFLVTTESNQTQVVQASTNLASSNWVNVATNTPASNSFTFTDTNALHYPARFYRVLR